MKLPYRQQPVSSTNKTALGRQRFSMPPSSEALQSKAVGMSPPSAYINGLRTHAHASSLKNKCKKQLTMWVGSQREKIEKNIIRGE